LAGKAIWEINEFIFNLFSSANFVRMSENGKKSFLWTDKNQSLTFIFEEKETFLILHR
jgi:hypothetical protein